MFCERLSQRSTEVLCRTVDEERSRKSKAIDEQRCGAVFLREHISPRTSSTVVRVQVVVIAESGPSGPVGSLQQYSL